MATAKDVKVIQHYNRSKHKFEIDAEISKETAMNLQTELGYHPAGYGFTNFVATPNKTIWFCWNNCD